MPILQAVKLSNRLCPRQWPIPNQMGVNGFEKFSKLQVLDSKRFAGPVSVVPSGLVHRMLMPASDVVSQLDLCRLTREQICVMARAGVVDLETDFGWPQLAKE